MNNKLKGFKEVKQKASMENANFKELLDLIKKNQKKFSDIQDECKDLVNRFDSKRDDALQYSFKSVVKNLKGVSLNVAFDGKSKIVNMTCLSRGQQSIVSLASIVAILWIALRSTCLMRPI